MISTPDLAKKEGVKITTIRDSLWRRGHFRGYTPVGFVEGSNVYLWGKV